MAHQHKRPFSALNILSKIAAMLRGQVDTGYLSGIESHFPRFEFNFIEY